MKVSAVAIALGLFATPALAGDFDGTPFHVGSGATGCLHFELKEFPGFVFGIQVSTGQNQQVVWADHVIAYSLTGKELRVHAVGPMQDCRETPSALAVTGIGFVP